MKEKLREAINGNGGRLFAAAVLCAVTVVIIIMLSSAERRSEPPDVSTDPETETETQAPRTQGETAEISASLQNGNYIFDGYVFTVLCSDENTRGNFGEAEENPEIINKAVEERNASLKEKTGITIASLSGENALETAQNAYSAGDYTAFDAMALKLGGEISTLMLEGKLENLYTSLGIDATGAWFSQSAVNAFSRDEKLYAVTGSAVTGDNAAASVLFFSKKSLEALSYSAPDLYRYVEQGVWTLDRMHQMAVEARNEQDMTGEEDGYNSLIYINPDRVYEYLISAGARFMSLNDRGEGELTASSGPADAMQSLLNINKDKIYITGNADIRWSKTLFCYGSLGEAEAVTVRKYSLGVLPCPTYGEGVGYTAFGAPDTAVFTAILKGNGSFRMISEVLDRIYEASANTIDSAYAASLGLGDTENLAMLNIIRASSSYDWFEVWRLNFFSKPAKDAYLSSDASLFASDLATLRTAAEWVYGTQMKKIFG